jgi:tetratricopeptide (TPR) repeat protein
VQALLEGRFEEAERLMVEALEMGQATEIPNAMMQFGVQLVHLRYQQARLGELLERLEWLAGEYPALPAWRCALAWAYGETGREEAARPVLAELARDRCAALPRDLLWLSDIAVLSRTAARLDDRAHAKVLYDLLLPYADRCLVDAPGASCSGSLSRELGILAWTLGRLDDAERHLRRALEMDQALRAPPHVVDTSLHLASMLIERARPGDHDEALELLRDVAGAVREMRMTRLLSPVSELEARVGVGSSAA